MGFFKRLRDGLARTAKSIREGVSAIFTGGGIKPDELDRLEDILLASDMGVKMAGRVRDGVADAVRRKKIQNDPDAVLAFVKNELAALLPERPQGIRYAASPPTVIFIVGVNGVGKTTTVGKLAWYLRSQGKSVLIAAADTFRAAAVEQLEIWAERAGARIMVSGEGADPSSVLHNACAAARSGGEEIILVDTAGRLHNKEHLMRELEKMKRVAERAVAGAPQETLLVLDATTGQNALAQARTFSQVLPLTGLVLAKLDGTAKGGVALAIYDEVKVPVKFVGVGEKVEDMAEFSPRQYVDAMFGGETENAP
ncbi:MAG TPA: signal recognition particle-docking protein FtsY [Planctomycetes bacterium]|nr:signal recognition particle-docking protein FtsY [Planctomycetota bacterium]